MRLIRLFFYIMLIAAASIGWVEADDRDHQYLMNFGKPLELLPVDGNGVEGGELTFYQLDNRWLIGLAGRVIVRGKAAALAKLQQKFPQIESLQILAKLNDGSAIALVFLTPDVEPIMLARLLAVQAGVLYAQPDMVQLNELQGHPATARYGNYSLAKDIHLDQAWKLTKGLGVRVAVIDDGFDISHEDFDRKRWVFQADISTGVLDASPKRKQDYHGTQVAGIIFAQHNGIGGDGIAPEAEVVAIRMVSGWTSELVKSFEVARLANADVINCSWRVPLKLQPVADIIQDLARHGRQGKGTPIVFSAGNRPIRVTVEDLVGIEEVITVAALNHAGQMGRSAYGEPIDIAAPSMLETTISKVGVDKKYSQLGATSSAAPVVTGVVTLMLSLNPQLTVREITQTLKRSADPVGGSKVAGTSRYIPGKINAIKALTSISTKEKL